MSSRSGAARREALQPVQMISSVTGAAIHDIGMLSNATYWVGNMIQPVDFLSALKNIVARSRRTRQLGAMANNVVHALIEIGPHPALRRPTQLIMKNFAPTRSISYSYTLSRQKLGIETLLELVGFLWSSGYPVSLAAANETELSPKLEPNVLIDLPEYPSDHSRSYWYESEMSKHARLRKYPRLELLGTPMPDWNNLESRWRKFFNTTETPWIEDHKVNGKPIYPATGMMVMFIKGAKQIAESDRPIGGHSVRDAVSSRPINVDGSAKTEVQLLMRPIKAASENDSMPSEYRICIREGDEWRENCWGIIQTDYKTWEDGLGSDQRYAQRAQYYLAMYEQAQTRCSRPVGTNRMYEHFQKNGLTYGPAFQALENLAWDGTNGSLGTI
ncbi:MAG: hypothetical protein LQ338_006828 [Usnochroma carphineum]|nr:MAG: hypothetical protein LQ338_006828 [Usnochroma carphineum]